MNNDVPMLFLPGLGASSQLFFLQAKRYPGLVAADWILPTKGESLDDYLSRWLSELKIEKIDIVGGASFGGLLAQRIARPVGARNCVIFGSIKCREEIPKRIKWCRPLHYLAFPIVIRFWQLVVQLICRLFGSWIGHSGRSVLMAFCQTDARLLQWSLRQLYICLDELPSSEETDQQIQFHQIHGEHDKVFPSGLLRERPDTTIHRLSDAGHLLTLFEAPAVNRIINTILDESK